MSTTVYLTIATDAGAPFHHDVVGWRPAYRHLIVHQWQPRARPCQRRELQRCRLRAKHRAGPTGVCHIKKTKPICSWRSDKRA